MNQEEKRKQIELQQKIMWEFNFYFQKNILDQRLLLVNIKNYHLLLITIKNYYLLHNLWRSVTEIFGSGQFFKIKFRRVFWYCELYTRNKANFTHVFLLVKKTCVKFVPNPWKKKFGANSHDLGENFPVFK